MGDFFFKPKRVKHLCCPPPIEKMDINSPLLVYKFPCKIKLAMKVNSSVGSSNHNQCYTVANEKLNAYGKWAGCPGGSGPGYSSTMRYFPNDNGSGLGPTISGAICNCAYIDPTLSPSSLPVNTMAPAISGITLFGSTLRTTNGTWTGFPAPTFTYQWLREDALIPNQTNDKYVTQGLDIGQEITCRVTGTNSAGSGVGRSNVIIVTSLPFNILISPPAISGKTRFGSTLTTTNNGTWTGFPAPTFTYEWLREGASIPNQTKNTYVTQLADIGKQITCRVTGTNSAGSGVGISDVIIVASLPVNNAAPEISGNTLVGSTLTTTNGTWTGFPAPTFTYEWYSGTTPLSGQTKNTYVTQLADIGQRITCRVIGTNSAGSAIAISDVIIVASLPVNNAAPEISGNRSSGATLTTTNGTWTGVPAPTFMYQWLKGGALITTQTNDKYVTQGSDIGQQITCRVTGTNSAGSASAISNVIIVTDSSPQNIKFSDTVIFETIYINSLNAVVTSPVLNGFTIYRVTSTSSTASYVINSNSLSVTISFLIIGGGGSGASTGGAAIESGGGGGGGFIESSGTTNSNTAYSIYVGKGGFLLNSTANGENSLLQLISGTLTAVGGGGGGNLNTNLNGLNGGSGGGGAFNYNNNVGTGGNGTPGQGFSGASGAVGPLAGSGGGAGGNGISNSLNGGLGLSSSITGQSIYYAGGGGGRTRSGGIGGGGEWGTPGTNGLGGGGGGSSVTGTSGGSGVVILRIPSFI